MALTKDPSVVYEHSQPGILIINHANSAIANFNHCLSLGLAKTDYEMSFIPHNYSAREI